MARVKNSSRSKRKYTDVRKTTTERNRISTTKRHELRTARLVARTAALVGKEVYYRTTGQIKPRVGTVVEVVSAPEGASRKGNYLSIRDSAGMLHVKSRSRVKPVRTDNAI